MLMRHELTPDELDLLTALAAARARDDRPSLPYLASLLATGIPEVEEQLHSLFAMGRIGWQVIIPGARGGSAAPIVDPDPYRLSPRVTRRGLEDLRRARGWVGGRQRTTWDDVP